MSALFVLLRGPWGSKDYFLLLIPLSLLVIIYFGSKLNEYIHKKLDERQELLSGDYDNHDF